MDQVFTRLPSYDMIWYDNNPLDQPFLQVKKQKDPAPVKDR